jgi:integrase
VGSILNPLTVAEYADQLGVSECWIYRHQNELPRLSLPGRVLRFSPELGTLTSGKSLKPGRKVMPSRYQRGHVRQQGKSKVWYGMYREDVMLAEGVKRRQRQVRLGTKAELPTKSDARAKLAEIMSDSQPSTVISFKELVDRWKKAEGPTLKPSTLKTYERVLVARVLSKFKTFNITEINREIVQRFLAERAVDYSKSTLKSMRCVLNLTLKWARNCGWIQNNPCEGIRLPRVTGGRQVKRTVLTPEQIQNLASKVKEPYATLLLLLGVSGLRIGEAVALKRSDFSGDIVHVTRRVWEGEVDDVKTKRAARDLPIDPGLVKRMLGLKSSEWVFESRNGTPVNPGNALKRYIRPAARELGITLGGWHDSRHTLNTTLRRNGVDPRVRSSILGHSKVALAMDVYDHPDVSDFKQPLADIADRLLQTVTKTRVAA